MLLKNIITPLPYLFYNLGRKRLQKNPESPAAFGLYDHFPHRDYAIEWWYFSGALHSEVLDGLFGFCATFFRIEAPSEGRILHFGITDMENDMFMNRKIAIPFYPQRLDPKRKGHVISIFRNSLIYDEDENKLHLNARLGGLGIKLSMEACDAVGHGKNGIIDYEPGACGASFYYSFPCLACHGEIMYAGKTSKVSGTVWHDRQWGSFNPRKVKWNWFSVRFDREQLYIMALKCDSGNYWSTCTLKNTSGIMQMDQIAIKPEHINVAKDGILCPACTEIMLSIGYRKMMSLKVTTNVRGQHMTSFITPSYWEGLCMVEGYFLEDLTLGDFTYGKSTMLSGHAYMELVGYE